MAWWNPFKPKPKPAPAPTPAPAPSKPDAPLAPGQQGPTRPQPAPTPAPAPKPSGGGGGNTYIGTPTSNSPSGTYLTPGGGVSYQAPSGSVGAALTPLTVSKGGGGGGGASYSGNLKTSNNAEIMGSADVAVGQQQSIQPNKMTPSSITPAKDIQYQNMGFIRSTGLAFSTLGSNIVYNVGAAFDPNKNYKWDSVLGNYKYTSWGGKFVETNPNLIGSTSIIKPGTVSPGESPYYSKKEFAEKFLTTYKVTDQGLQITGPDLTSVKTTRAENVASGISGLGKNVLQTLPYVGPIAISRDESSFKTTINPITDSKGQVIGYSRDERLTPQATLNLGFSAFSTIATVPSTLRSLEMGQVGASSEYLNFLSKKTPYTGTRSFNGGFVKDVYGKTIKTDSGWLSSKGFSFTSTTDDTFKQTGNLLNQQQITGYWSGNIYRSTEMKNLFTSGKILSETGKGIVPSVSRTYEFTPLRTTSVVGRDVSKMNVYFNTMPDTYFSVGRANEATFPGYILGEGGKLKNLKIDTGLRLTKIEQGPAFSSQGNVFDLEKFKSFKADVPKGGRIILKIKPEKGKVLDFGIAGGLPAQSSTRTITTTSTPTPFLSSVDLSQQLKSGLPYSTNFFKQGASTLTKTSTFLPAVSSSYNSILNTNQQYKTFTTTLPITNTFQSTSKLVTPITGTALVTTPFQTSKTITAFPPALTSGGAFTSLFAGGLIPGGLLPGLPSLDFNSPRVGKYGAKSRRKYTPSYDALIFGKKGKAPKGLAGTALGARPITKGFKWEFGKFKL